MRSDLLVRVVLTIAMAVPVVLAGPQALAQGGADQGFADAVNSARGSAGLPALEVDAALTNLACRHSREMSDAGVLFHGPPDPALAAVPGATAAGENVGQGGSVPLLMDAFLASPGHSANIHNGAYTHFGSCTVVGADSGLWTTHIFVGAAPTPVERQPASVPQPPPSPPDPEPAPVAEPRPVAEPPPVSPGSDLGHDDFLAPILRLMVISEWIIELGLNGHR